MSSVWVVTLNGNVHAVHDTALGARYCMQQVRETLKGAGAWSPVGGDPETATAWSAKHVTCLMAKPWTVEA